jgi:hypothetical protein
MSQTIAIILLVEVALLLVVACVGVLALVWRDARDERSREELLKLRAMIEELQCAEVPTTPPAAAPTSEAETPEWTSYPSINTTGRTLIIGPDTDDRVDRSHQSRPTMITGIPHPPLVLERLVEERWVPFAVRPAHHHDVSEIRAGLHPGVRIQGDADAVV